MLHPKLKAARLERFKELCPDGWKSLSDTHQIAECKEHNVVLSHFRDRTYNTLLITEGSELEFMEHFLGTGSPINQKATHDLTDVKGDLLSHSLKELSTWFGIEYPMPRKPKVHSLTLGNSEHPVKKYGLTAHAIKSTHDNYDNCFWVMVEDAAMVINTALKAIIVIHPDSKRGIDRLKIMVRAREPLPFTEERMYPLDPLNKYIGNDIMRIAETLR